MMPYEVNRAILSSTMCIIEKCGHFPWIEQPGEFYSAVLEFLYRSTIAANSTVAPPSMAFPTTTCSAERQG